MVTEEVKLSKPATPAVGDNFQFRHKVWQGLDWEHEVTFQWTILKSGTVQGVILRAELFEQRVRILEPLLLWQNNGGAVWPGAAKYLGMSRGETCPDCKGSGKIVLFTTADTCKKCGGKGEV